MSSADSSGAGSHLPPLAIIGAGRMGRTVDTVAAARGWPVRARVTGRAPITADTLRGAAVAIEFTSGAASPGIVVACAAAGCAVVSGTTGWESALPAVQAEVLRLGGALLWASNFALGAHLLRVVGVEVARGLAARQSYDAVLVETHHRRKLDAPSGTARTIADAVAAAWHGPIPITSVRIGDVPGDHELIFDGPYEQIRLVHSVRDRKTFGDGALTAAAWLVGRRGIFSIDDVLRASNGDAPRLASSHLGDR